MMDPATVIRELGGGAAAILVVLLIFAVSVLWRRDIANQDRIQKMIEDGAKEARENQAVIFAAFKANDATLNAATASMNAAIEELRRRPK